MTIKDQADLTPEDLERLEKLARESQGDGDWSEGDETAITFLEADDIAFVAACSPDTILRLLDALASLRAQAAENVRLSEDIAGQAFDIAKLRTENASLRARLESLEAALHQISLRDGILLQKQDGIALDVTAAKQLYDTWAEIIRIARAALSPKEPRHG